jgi:hypothetical protein
VLQRTLRPEVRKAEHGLRALTAQKLSQKGTMATVEIVTSTHSDPAN